MSKEKTTAILGAGLVGSLLSGYLKKHGYDVTIYERRSDMRKDRISAGRSINLALSDRGWRGLEGVGLADAVRKVAIPMKGRMIHNLDGSLTYQPYGKEGQAIYSVSRGGLNCVMMDEAEKLGAKIVFNQKCKGVDLNTNTITLEDENSKVSTVQADLIFGSDGAFSAVRNEMMSSERFNYSQQYLEHGYKELSIPPTDDGGFHLEKNALHIWPRGGYMLIALPNPDGSFTCTLFFPFKGSPSFEELDSPQKVVAFFKEVFPDALDLMPNLEKEYFENPTSSLVIVRCYPWTINNKVMLIGDAAHAIVPFYGQGMNAGFEDCVDLEKLLIKHNNDWDAIMPEYQQMRKPAGDAIADLAVKNFYEMRDLVGQPEFLLRKKIEGMIYDNHPDKWVPLYSMVTFSDTPYHKALAEGKRQEKIMDKIMALPEIESKWDSQEVQDSILKMLS